MKLAPLPRLPQFGRLGALRSPGQHRPASDRLAATGGVLVIALLTAAATTQMRGGQPSSQEPTVRVRYETIGSARVGSVSYETPTGPATEAGVALPIGKREFVFDRQSFVFMTVERTSDSGTVGCRIRVNDNVVVQNETTPGSSSQVTCETRS